MKIKTLTITKTLQLYGLVESWYRLGVYDEEKNEEIDNPYKGSILQILGQFKQRNINKNAKYIIITNSNYIVMREVIVDDKNINDPCIFLHGLPAFIYDNENKEKQIDITIKLPTEHDEFKKELESLTVKDFDYNLDKSKNEYYNSIIKDFSIFKNIKYVGHSFNYTHEYKNN